MLRLIISTIVFASFTSLVAAQSKPQSEAARDALRDSNRQEMDNLLLRKPITTVEDNSVRLAKLKQVNEDFRQLQNLNSEVRDCVNQNCMARKLSEINERATRLRKNLQLPFEQKDRVKEKWKEISTPDELRARLLDLDGFVLRFVKNPTFGESKVIDVENANKAAQDLLAIVEVSRRLRKAAAKLAEEH